MAAQSDNRIVISALGAITPVGANIEQSYFALQAGMTPFAEHPAYSCTPEDPEWDEDLPMYVASVPVLSPLMQGSERFTQLAIPAISEALDAAKLNRQALAQTGLLMALPTNDSATQSLGLNGVWIAQLCKRLGLSGLKVTETNSGGHTGVFSLINKASELLQSGQLEYCIVGGVDSYLIKSRLKQLDKDWRLKSSRNVDGLIPGESAAVLVLETEAHARARGVTPLAAIEAIGSGAEVETLKSSGKVSSGQGLTDAINSALTAKSTNFKVENVYCSLNGESYYAFEWGLILGRLGPTFERLLDTYHPAESCGDIGAATGSLLISYATMAFQKQKTESSNALLWSASEGSERMALLMERI